TELQQLAQQRCQLDWNQHFMDSTAVQAHQHAAGAPRPSDQDECLGRSRGGLSTKCTCAPMAWASHWSWP
ncbi:MAG: hypothetical protein BRC37_12685, partial [Cyanobacteria bacterium QH_3_48_40]